MLAVHPCHAKKGFPGNMRAAGCLHPDHEGYFESPAQYLAWYRQHGPLRGNKEAPVVAVLLYRWRPLMLTFPCSCPYQLVQVGSLHSQGASCLIWHL